MHSINKILTYFPVSLFLSVVLFNYLFLFVDVSNINYLTIYYNFNEILGAPIVTNLFLLGACYRYKFCNYNKVSVLGLLLLNVINLIAINTSLGESEYYCAVTHLMIAPVAILVTILLIKKL